MAWDFSTEPEFEQQLAWMRTFVREEILPLETLDLDGPALRAATAPMQEEVKARGLWAAHLPPELGGGGFGQVKLGLMHEILGQCVYAPSVFGNNAPDSGNAELLALGANEAQKKQWMEPLLDGRLRSAFSMTEPNAGADPTLLTTRAERVGDEYVINGHKWFTSNGSVADFLILMAVTDPDAAPRRRASMFVVPVTTPGVDVVRDIPTMEHPEEGTGYAGGHSEVLYRDVRVPAENLIGAEGDGFLLAQKRLGPGRIHHCMRWLGQSRRAFDMLCERAISRHTHGSLLSEKQMVQDWIATSTAEMTAARLMTLQAAWKMDQGGTEAALTDIAMIKFYGASVLYNVIDRAIQVHGSLGYTTDLPLESMYRHARAARITTAPTRSTRSPSRAGCCATTSPARCPRSTCRPAARRRGGSSRTCWTRRRSARGWSSGAVDDPQGDLAVALDEVGHGEVARRVVPLRDGVARGDDRAPGVLGVGAPEVPARDAVVDDLGPQPARGLAHPVEPRPVLRGEVAPLGGRDGALDPAAHAVLHGGAHEREQALGGVVTGVVERALAAAEVLLGALLDEQHQQVLLAGVPVVERGEGQTGPAGDVADRGAVVPLLGEALARRARDRVPAAPARHRRGGAHRVSIGRSLGNLNDRSIGSAPWPTRSCSPTARAVS